MRLLVAAVDADPAGWTWTVPGELVHAAAFCDLADTENHDPAHDCLFSFVGVASGRACTLAQVADLEVTREQLADIVWVRLIGTGADLTEAKAEVKAMLDAAANWPAGTRLRRHGEELEAA